MYAIKIKRGFLILFVRDVLSAWGAGQKIQLHKWNLVLLWCGVNQKTIKMFLFLFHRLRMVGVAASAQRWTSGASFHTYPVSYCTDFWRDISVSAEEGAITNQSFYVSNQPRPMNQFELNDLVRDLNLTKECADVVIYRYQKDMTKLFNFSIKNVKLSTCTTLPPPSPLGRNFP